MKNIATLVFGFIFCCSLVNRVVFGGSHTIKDLDTYCDAPHLGIKNRVHLCFQYLSEHLIMEGSRCSTMSYRTGRWGTKGRDGKEKPGTLEWINELEKESTQCEIVDVKRKIEKLKSLLSFAKSIKLKLADPLTIEGTVRKSSGMRFPEDATNSNAIIETPFGDVIAEASKIHFGLGKVKISGYFDFECVLGPGGGSHEYCDFAFREIGARDQNQEGVVRIVEDLLKMDQINSKSQGSGVLEPEVPRGLVQSEGNKTDRMKMMEENNLNPNLSASALEKKSGRY